jgi:extracellular factor (EF) 3-hydroxypalmitic acid methyl ester biosynthesis protein
MTRPPSQSLIVSQHNVGPALSMSTNVAESTRISAGTTMPALRDAIDAYAGVLAKLEATANDSNEPAVLDALQSATEDVVRTCARAELSLSIQDVLAARAYFQSQTAQVLEQSWIIERARRWPRGYQGDFKIIEAAYSTCIRSNTPMGRVIDKLVLGLDLAHAVRGRLAMMREAAQEEIIRHSTGVRVINLACGPCRELVDFGSLLRERDAHVVCVDHDPEALAYARNLLTSQGLDGPTVQFLLANALRLATPNAWYETFGRADVIYSMGVFDYLRDRTVAHLLTAAFANLNAGGCLIVPFKDCMRYDATPFRWLMNWTGFRERNTAQVLDLVRSAGLPEATVSVDRDRTGIIVFVRVRR